MQEFQIYFSRNILYCVLNGTGSMNKGKDIHDRSLAGKYYLFNIFASEEKGTHKCHAN